MGTKAASAVSRGASGAAQSRRWPLAVIGATGNQRVPEVVSKPEEKDDASHRLMGDTPPQNGCCRALESTAGELAESKADRRFAALSGARTALYSAGKVTAR